MINRLFNPVFNEYKTNLTSLALKPYFELDASLKRVMFTNVLNYFFFSNNCGHFSNKILPHCCLTHDFRF